ncbi:dihydrofolate reductase family protein [Actinomadura parmotrematis]|uniref:Dihydrofolate reductase family protein n=1 Tax=Actinomadura parmotrematis TaxID=2864039 RepID=A0ABS7FWH3_9ACTN|nr:dihydrofolate reductase family protein [Actinomadura parmotrematis]MBW8484773.1 dihydrofolate reductase family protein [Actinomadura parmotrematis]
MGKLIYHVHVSVDGFVEGPGGVFDWAEMGPELSDYGAELDGRVRTLLYGRKVWEVMSSYWPKAEEVSDHPHDLRYAPVWRSKPKAVVSRTLETAGWNTRVLDGPEGVRKLKEEGDVLLNGGAGLAGALADAGLVDEFLVMVHPVVLGGGRRVLPVDGRVGLRLEEARVFDGRVTLLRYSREV